KSDREISFHHIKKRSKPLSLPKKGSRHYHEKIISKHALKSPFTLCIRFQSLESRTLLREGASHIMLLNNRLHFFIHRFLQRVYQLSTCLFTICANPIIAFDFRLCTGWTQANPAISFQYKLQYIFLG